MARHQLSEEQIQALTVGKERGFGPEFCALAEEVKAREKLDLFEVSQGFKVVGVGDWIVLCFWDTDRHEPLAPQVFALRGEEWWAVSRALRDPGEGYQLGDLRTLSVARQWTIDTRDQYGPHFCRHLDEPILGQIDQKVESYLKGHHRLVSAEVLKHALASGSHEFLIAASDLFEPTPEALELLGACLHPEARQLLPFAFHRVKGFPDLHPTLVETVIDFMEETSESRIQRDWAVRLLEVTHLSEEQVRRVAALLPTGKYQHLYLPDFLSLLERHGGEASLQEVFAPILEFTVATVRSTGRLKTASERPAGASALRVLGKVPSRWKESRPAVEFALENGYEDAEQVKNALLSVMPVAWEEGLQRIEKTKRPKLPPAQPIAPIFSQPEKPGLLQRLRALFR